MQNMWYEANLHGSTPGTRRQTASSFLCVLALNLYRISKFAVTQKPLLELGRYEK